MKRKMRSKYCNDYLENCKKFQWFIVQYFGLPRYARLIDLAMENQESALREELNCIWFDLPDSIFNIQNMPEGWECFLSFVEE